MKDECLILSITFQLFNELSSAVSRLEMVVLVSLTNQRNIKSHSVGYNVAVHEVVCSLG